MPRALWKSQGGGVLMREVPLYPVSAEFHERLRDGRWEGGMPLFYRFRVQGYLAHKKTPPPRTLH